MARARSLAAHEQEESVQWKEEPLEDVQQPKMGSGVGVNRRLGK